MCIYQYSVTCAKLIIALDTSSDPSLAFSSQRFLSDACIYNALHRGVNYEDVIHSKNFKYYLKVCPKIILKLHCKVGLVEKRISRKILVVVIF